MSRKKDTQLQLFAFDMELSKWEGEIIYQLYIPEAWKTWVLQLRKGSQGNDYTLKKRIKPLGEKLKGIFPDLVMVDNEFYKDTKKPWLLAVRPISISTLILLVKAWFLKTASEVGIPVPDDVQSSELEWKTITISQACKEANDLYFNLLPSLVAHRFCQSEKTLQLKEEDEPLILRFSKVFATREVDCMSQPISTKRGQFSYVVRFRLKTRGGEPNRYMLLITFGVRRIITKPVNTQKLKGKIHCTLLVSIDNPYTEMSQENVRSFASLSYRRQGNQAPYTRWREGLDELFFDLLWDQPFTPEEILTNPERFGEGCNPRVMVIHNQQVFRSHLIGSGVSIGEKRQFFEILVEELAQWTPLAPIAFIPKPKSVFEKNKDKGNLLPMLVPHAKDFILEIWGPDALYDQVINVLRDKKYKLNAIVEEEDETVFRLVSRTGNRMTLMKRERQGYVDALEAVHGKEAYTHRVNIIERTLEDVMSTEQVTLSLIEILPKENWEKMWEGADPKLAIREGFRRTGRLTQFIYPKGYVEDGDEGQKGSNYKHKVFNAILDLLSDAGVVEFKPLFEMGEVPPIVSFDLIHVDHGDFPVLTKLHQGKLFVRGDGMEEWLPLHQAILNSHMLKPAPYLKKDQSWLTRWLDEQLRREKLNTEAFILLIGAHLRTKGISALTNGRVSKEQNPPIASWIQEDPDIKVIRINTTDELPAYGFIPLSLSTGVYSDGTSGIYYGVGTKGLSQRGIRKDMTKLHDPSKTFQQPRAVEYMPLGKMEESERDRLAWIVHLMREMCISFEITQTLPYPLKMMKSIEKYIKRKYIEWNESEAEFV
ncbi:pPIWI_RE module domain-containing protein [Tumebacillus lipolyticus]|uniref:PPIWI_RE module domain-containing protein n=1 Tax=Tumebacillus lipolyticus TaxID=1280370 RepID=A0ABW4ZZK8_9BACL